MVGNESGTQAGQLLASTEPFRSNGGGRLFMEDILGKVVYSKTGRDQGRMFIIVGVINDRFVTVADGSLRKIENPKVKNIKHVQFTGVKADEIVAIIKSGETPGNHILRKYLKNIGTTGVSDGKEVW